MDQQDRQDHQTPEMTRRNLIRNAVLAGAGLAVGGTMERADAGPVPAIGPTYDVRLFGAVGDGSTDDTASVQAALDAAMKARGGHVHVPSGRYRITKSLVIGSQERVDITGNGATSVLLHENNEPLLMWKEGISCRESSIRHLCITSMKNDKTPDVAAISCKGGTERSLFDHLLFNTEGAKMGSGIVVENVMDTTTLDRCLFWGPVSGTGIRVARGSEVRIFGGRVLGSGDPYQGTGKGSIGIHLAGGNGGVHIVTTDLIGLHTGLKIGEAGAPSNREVFITHATFDSDVHGLWQIDQTYTSIAGCWAASSDEDQILIDDSAQNALLVISGGTIFNAGAYGRPGSHHGLVVRGGSFVLSGVMVRHNKGTGILVGEKVRDYAINGCRITNNGTGAVLGGDRYTFSGNVVTQNGIGLIDRGGPEKQLTGNLIAPDAKPKS